MEDIFDDLIAKAIQILEIKGTEEHGVLGKYIFFEDSKISIQTFENNGLDLLIKNINGNTVLEIWKGTVVIHKGDHGQIYKHLSNIFSIFFHTLK